MKLRLAFAAIALSLVALPQAQTMKPSSGSPTIEQFLSAAYPLDLTSAKKADRLAWVSYDEGKRNIYTAAAPGVSAGAPHVVLEGRRHGHDRSESVGRRRRGRVRARAHGESRRVGRQPIQRSRRIGTRDLGRADGWRASVARGRRVRARARAGRIVGAVRA